ncbi:MAG: hypothetical protein H6818_04645 [Phycisphaerales bacterium]|nr:hypothetical protein [Phycisphaerales bacterium]
MPQKLESTSDKLDSPVATPEPPAPGDAKKTVGTTAGPERRKSVVDRRSGLERRRGPGKRRAESRRTAEEGELDSEQFEFVMAIDEYKRANNRPFPSWTEVLEVIKYLGYRKVAEKGEHVDRPATSDENEN